MFVVDGAQHGRYNGRCHVVDAPLGVPMYVLDDGVQHGRRHGKYD